jgi:regulatory protein
MKKLSPQQAKEKIQRYCVYQERSHLEVRKKLYDLGVFGNDAEALLADLVTDGFLNEERFAKAFAGGKFRIKKWGKIKIKQALEQKGVSSYCVKSGLKEIDDDEYRDTLLALLEKKSEETEADNIYVLRDKLSKFVIQKGFEPDLVWQLIKERFPDR